MNSLQKAAIDELDAYEHCSYGMHYGEEGSDEGDMQIYGDFKVFVDTDKEVKVAVHVVVNSESGSFIDTTYVDILNPNQAFNFLDTYYFD
jgi:hypothetical protein